MQLDKRRQLERQYIVPTNDTSYTWEVSRNIQKEKKIDS